MCIRDRSIVGSLIFAVFCTLGFIIGGLFGIVVGIVVSIKLIPILMIVDNLIKRDK